MATIDAFDHRSFALIRNLFKERDLISDEVLQASFSDRHLEMVRSADLTTYRKWVAEAAAWAETHPLEGQ